MVTPFCKIGWVGVIAMLVIFFATTLTWTVPLMVCMVAVTVAEPGVSPVTWPLLLPVLPTDAVLASDELQVAWEVTSCLLPSENTPVAIRFTVWPMATGATVWMLIDCNMASRTVTVAVAVLPW